jgi:hypothetical protein
MQLLLLLLLLLEQSQQCVLVHESSGGLLLLLLELDLLAEAELTNKNGLEGVFYFFLKLFT